MGGSSPRRTSLPTFSKVPITLGDYRRSQRRAPSLTTPLSRQRPAKQVQLLPLVRATAAAPFPLGRGPHESERGAWDARREERIAKQDSNSEVAFSLLSSVYSLLQADLAFRDGWSTVERS